MNKESRLGSVVITLYKILGHILYFSLRLYNEIAFWRSAKDKGRLSQQLALVRSFPLPNSARAPLIWLHGASLGESAALMPLMQMLLQQGFRLLFTSNRDLALQMIAQNFGDKLYYQYAPFDLAPALKDFLNYWRPAMVIIIEAELWPLRMIELDKRHIMQVNVSAYMSDKSYNLWYKYRSLAQILFSKIDLALCQNASDAQKYRALGVKQVEVSGNLKADTLPLGMDNISAKQFFARQSQINDNWQQRPRWAAISLHRGEEQIAASIHKELREFFPDLLTIIVPRYLDRVEQDIASLREQGFTVAQHSKEELITKDSDIFYGDTIGEMGFYLQLTDIVFIGKSLAAKGGHNPMEAALLRKAIISGPFMANFRDFYRKLEQEQAVIIVDNAKELALAVKKLLGDKAFCQALGKKSYAALSVLAGPLEKTCKALEPFLAALKLQAKISNQ